jgi:hypothetical protein
LCEFSLQYLIFGYRKGQCRRRHMDERVSNRHEGDLGGRLSSFGDMTSVGVTVVIPDGQAQLPAVQHTAWMVLNLLARLDRVVHCIGLRCPSGVPLAGNITPLAKQETDLRSALLDGAAAIEVVPVVADAELGWSIVVGTSGPIPGTRLYAAGAGWNGGVSRNAIDGNALSTDSRLPFGPYVAACLAVAEVFKGARMKDYEPTTAAFYDLWTHRASTLPTCNGPSRVETGIDAALAGVGAVGSACVLALWACPGLAGKMILADSDRKGLTVTNLNRYPLFGRRSLGELKASEAARLVGKSGISWTPHDDLFEKILAPLPPRVLSAVDTNRSRLAIQNRYPSRILSASTLDLRSEVLRCGPPGVGACLRCYNPPEVSLPDDDLRAKLLSASAEEIAGLAASANVSVEDAKEWARTGRCGTAGERVLPYLRTNVDEPLFAVGFVSVMAGTMLAVELLKDCIGAAVPLSDAIQRATLQFFNPLARTNRASRYAPDRGCPMCKLDSPAGQVWNRRFQELGPARAIQGDEVLLSSCSQNLRTLRAL